MTTDTNADLFARIGKVVDAHTVRRIRYVTAAVSYATNAMGRGVRSPGQHDVLWAPDGEDEALIRLRPIDGGDMIVLHVFDGSVAGETTEDDFIRNGGRA